MYDKEFYSKVDALMIGLLKRFAVAAAHTAYACVRYIALQPVRLYEYVRSIFHEKEELGEEEHRFQNLKATGHI